MLRSSRMVHLGFQVIGFSTENRLNTRTSNHYARCAQFLQASLIHFRHISNADAQTGNTCVEVSNVFFTTKCSNQSRCHFAGTCRFCIFSRIFTTRRFQIQCFNQHAEDGVVNNGITDTDDREQPQFAAVTRQNDEVDQTVRERRTVTHPQKNTDWECQACQNRVDDVQDRRNEHEGELDEFMNGLKENECPDLLTLAKARGSVRSFKSSKVERAKLEYILEVARLAPSAVNFQPWAFVVVRDPEKLKALYDCYPREWFASAPMCIVVCGDHSTSWKRLSDNKDFCDVDIAIATEHLVLAAAEQGLGSCWVCNFDVQRCKKILNLPDLWEPMVLLPLGYPAEGVETERKRKPFNDVVRWEDF